MTFKTITRRGRDWLWPEYDTELIKVFDQVDDIDTILKYCPKRRVAIQAGGACGVWPWRLSQEFAEVYAYEPDDYNFHCLEANTANIENVTAFRCALGAYNAEEIDIVRHPSESCNAGAGYVVPWHGPDVMACLWSIDCLLYHQSISDVSLIQLDVEGYEIDALMGAQLAIWKYQPTIVIEEKPLPQGGDHLAARRLLESWGYVERERIHRDVIFTRES